MALEILSPSDAQKLIQQGATLIDIRNTDEFARAKVPFAENRPLDGLERVDADGPVIFMCKSGMRTGGNAAKLGACCNGEAYLLEGGLDNWRKAGLPIAEDASQPLEIMRQVQIAAGLLILVGVLLGTFVAPAWYGLSAFVGAGLFIAGATGWCGMAKLLAFMPWNRRAIAG